MLSLRRFIASFNAEAFLKFTLDRHGDPICAINIADSAPNTVSEKQHLEAKCITRKLVFYRGFFGFPREPAGSPGSPRFRRLHGDPAVTQPHIV
jgi:hypothetical protein